MIYRLILALRHLAYKRGWKKSSRAAVPTICVGNVTVGGTGKTPHTEMILRKLRFSDAWAFRNVAVLSRGYKRKTKGFQIVDPSGKASLYGDEPLQIARAFPEVTVAVDANRVEGCERLAADPVKADIIVLDDAFQYRKLEATLNIVLVDYHRPVYNDKLLPWGRLRDLPSRLQEAQMVIVTKCPASPEQEERTEWRQRLKLNASQQLFFTTISYAQPKPVFDQAADVRFTYAPRLVLVSGIANDAPLRNFLSDSYKIVRRLAFPDHHAYTRRDVRKIMSAIKEHPTACLMTTEKDAQRFRDVENIPLEIRQRLFYVPIQAQFFTPEEDEAFTETLLESL